LIIPSKYDIHVKEIKIYNDSYTGPNLAGLEPALRKGAG
jgi:hypothetical protein